MHHGHHETSFILFSILVAMLGSWTALDLQRQVRAHEGKIRGYWLGATAVAMGVSIFSMHFIAMLGFDAGMPIRYDLGLTIGSLLLAVTATSLAFAIIQVERLTALRLAGAAVAMGAGICLMHYMGMAAMRVPATLSYDRWMVVASFVIAVTVSWAALLAALREQGLAMRVVGAVVLGLAICSMHYTAMAAVSFDSTQGEMYGTGELAQSSLALWVGVGTMFLLFLALVSAMFDRRFEALALREAGAIAAREAHLREVLMRMPLGVSVVSRSHRGEVSFCNGQAEAMIGSDHPSKAFLLNAAGDPLGPDEHPIRRVLELGQTVERELVRIRNEAGSRFVEVSAAPVPSAGGGTEEFVLIFQDVTERRETEQALQQAQKLETIGQLTGGVAHDFNNLLTPIIGGLEMVHRDEGLSRRSRAVAEGALQAASKAATLVQRLLAFARRQSLQPRTVDIQVLLVGLSDLIERSIGAHLQVRINAVPNLVAKVDPGQLELAVLNLVVNARDAMPKGGEISISGVFETIGTRHSSALPPGDYVRISVSDTGAGMDAETLKRAVEPFFSTKDVGKGTGLGLSMVHGLAAQSNGALRLSSTLGFGTRADLWLPFGGELDEQEPVSRAKVDDAPVSATILVVDDEELVRMATSEMLRAIGYEVVEAASASEAMRHLRQRADIDMLVTDHMMPAKTGVQLVEEVAALWPALPSLIITGYAVPERFPNHIPRLAKPFRQEELARAVAPLLSAAPTNVLRLPSSNFPGAAPA